MKKSFSVVTLGVLGLFLSFVAFGLSSLKPEVARADDRGVSGGGLEVRVGAGNQVSDSGDEIENKQERGDSLRAENDDELEIEDEDVRSTSTLELSVKHRQEELDKEASSTDDENEKEVLKNQNGMRLAVHALLASKNLLGGIGPQVSVLAKDLNSSVSSTLVAEEKLQARGWFQKLFFGGDKESADTIQSQVNKNREDINKLKALISTCTDCSPAVKLMLGDRLAIAEAEQLRLEAVAKAELDARGIFGTLFGWLNK